MKDLIESFERITEAKSVSDLPLSRLVITRLALENSGEIPHNFWWQSRLLSDFGTEKLKEIAPSTYLESQVFLAFEIVRKKEKDIIKDKDFLSLFKLTPEVEKLIASLIMSACKFKGSDFSNLVFAMNNVKTIETQSALGTKEHRTITTQREIVGTSLGCFCIDEIELKSIDNDKMNNIIEKLIYAWSLNKKGSLLIPYYRLKR